MNVMKSVTIGIGFLGLGLAFASPSFAAAYDWSGGAPPAILPGHGADAAAAAKMSCAMPDRTVHRSTPASSVQVVYVPVYVGETAPPPDLSHHSLQAFEDSVTTQREQLQNAWSNGVITDAQRDRESDAIDTLQASAHQEEFDNGGYLTGDQNTELLSQLDKIHQWILDNQAS